MAAVPADHASTAPAAAAGAEAGGRFRVGLMSDRLASRAASKAPYRRLAFIGGGAWGTALALTALRAGCACSLWIREAEIAQGVFESRETPFLPGYQLPEALAVTSRLAEALEEAELVVLVVPSQFLRSVARNLRDHLSPNLPLLICSKGIEAKSGALMHQVVEEELGGHPWAVLSGPSFAAEVAAGQPTAITVAAPDPLLAGRIAATFAISTFRPYTSDDPLGVEVGGAVKNVIAIACGIAQGCGFGANSRAALITRGLAEIVRLATALGARPETLAGLAGLGDLTLTCSSEQSRNFSFGMALGRGLSPEQAKGDSKAIVEGAENARSITALAERVGVEMPICEAVFEILYRDLPVQQAMQRLLTRPIKDEVEGASG